MASLPGFTFSDPTATKFHVAHNFDFINGHRFIRNNPIGIGEKEPDVYSCLYVNNSKEVSYDPSLTYGRSKGLTIPQFIPRYISLDKKCLTFKAFFKQSVSMSPDEHYRVRIVKIIYFLEDDTILVTEPVVPNSGFQQGRLIRRSKIPKSSAGFWHWKDFNIGIDVCFNGIFFHIVDCDKFTREYLTAQGIVLRPAEDTPPDPYTQNQQLKAEMRNKPTPKVDKFSLFLEYSDKVLKFDALWDDSDSEYGDKKKCVIYFHLLDNTISVKLLPECCVGFDACSLIIKKLKIPKVWFAYTKPCPVHLERSDHEVVDYYAPKDLIIGQTIHLLGRKFLLLDCDKFTRDYYQNMLEINQGAPIRISEPDTKYVAKPAESRPKGFEINKIFNANKYLRYALKMDAVHPEDSIREFILRYSLAHGTVEIFEKCVPNSGVTGGKFLRSTLLCTPDSTPDRPVHYTLDDFYIGATINVNGVRFIVTNADLNVYHYMEANPEKFSPEVMQNMKNHMVREGYLSAVLTDAKEEDIKIPTMEDIEVPKTRRELCMDQIEANLKAAEERLQDKQHASEKNVHFEDQPAVADVKLIEDDCKMTDLFEKHYPLPDKEVVRKYYNNVFKQYKELCHNKS